MFFLHYLIELMFLELDVYRFLSPLIVLVPQPFRLNSLRASLLTVLRVVYDIFRLSSGKTMVSSFDADLISCRFCIYRQLTANSTFAGKLG